MSDKYRGQSLQAIGFGNGALFRCLLLWLRDIFICSELQLHTSNGGRKASYVKGGSQQLSNALMAIIEENGGTVKLNCLVTEIMFETPENMPVICSHCQKICI